MEKENIIFKEFLNSKCPKDYKSRHYWEKLGVIEDSEHTLLVWRCSQCKKCITEELEFLELEDVKDKTQPQKERKG